MGKVKGTKQVPKPRTAQCPKCDKVTVVTRVQVIGARSGWHDRCNTCETMVN